MKRWHVLSAGLLMLGMLVAGFPVFAQSHDCHLTPPNDLTPGERIRVSDALGRGRLYIYTEPSDTGVTMARLMPGDELDLLPSGPVCFGAQQMWAVTTPDGRTGWLPAAIELDTNPDNLLTTVLEMARDPNVIYEDDFSTEDNWPEVQTTGYSVEYHNERYSMAQLEGGYNLWQWPLAPEIQDVADFTAAVDILPLADRGMAGLSFRHGGDSFYYLIIGPGDQTFQLMLYDQGEYTTLVPSTFSEAIAAHPATSRIQITAVGDQIALYANDQPLALIENGARRSGQLGLFVYSPLTSSAQDSVALFNFDNLLVTLPQSIDPAAFPEVVACQAQTGRNINIRSGPGENYSVLGSLSPNTPLAVTGRNGQWVAVSLNGREGWVANWVVTLTGNCGDLAHQEPSAPILAQQPAPQQPAEQQPAGQQEPAGQQPAQQPDQQQPAGQQPDQQPPAEQPPQQCSLTIVNGSGRTLTDIRLGKDSAWIGVAGGLDNGGSISLTVECGKYYDCSGLENGTTWWWDVAGNIPANGTCTISTPS